MHLSSSPYVQHALLPPHSPPLHYLNLCSSPNKIWWGAQIMKLLFMQSSTVLIQSLLH
jgi:hypothetical protein